MLAIPSESKLVMQLQFGLIILSSVSYLTYLIIVRPYKRIGTNKYNNYFVILSECIYLVFLLLLAFALYPNSIEAIPEGEYPKAGPEGEEFHYVDPRAK